MRSLNAQINFMVDYERRELAYLPKAVADGDLSQAAADAILANVQGIILTLRHAQLQEATDRHAMRLKGFDAGRRGDAEDSHGMKPDAATLKDWLVGYKKGLGVRLARFKQTMGRQHPHHAPASAQRIDARQGGAHL